MNGERASVRVRGDFACFTRPENKVERLSYPIITPSAARGVLEAIYWHPQFTWAVRSVRVLAPVRTYGLLRNEVNSKMAVGRDAPYFADDDRSQRYAVCLRDVDYIIEAAAVVKPGEADPAAKHLDIFARRVRRGQCFHRPCLGTREFAAEFEPVDGAPPPIDWTEELGLMLWDMDYSSGKPPYWPRFFRAEVNQGVMGVPDAPIGAER